MKKIIWLVGPSASGKETFIKNLCSKKISAINIMRNIGIVDEEFMYSAASILELVSDKTGLPEQRFSKILEDIERAKTKDNNLLVKWQIIDQELFAKIKEIYPDIQQIVIRQFVNEEVLKSRLPDKFWWNNDCSIIKKEEKLISTFIESLNGYSIFNIDSSSEYRLL